MTDDHRTTAVSQTEESKETLPPKLKKAIKLKTLTQDERLQARKMIEELDLPESF